MKPRGIPFKKGNKIATGRPKGSRNKLTLALQEAIEIVAKQKGKSLFEYFVERSYKNDNVLVALIRKLVADKTHVEGELREDVRVTVELVESEGKEG